MPNLQIFTFYRFVKVHNKYKIKKNLEIFFNKKKIKGTILLADEGINAAISGKVEDLVQSLNYIKKNLKIRKIDLKINEVEFLPFNKFKVRIKNEIVSIGEKKLDVPKHKGKYIKPAEWNKILEDQNIKLIDVRNIYEVKIGSFNGHINPNTTNFRNFPSIIKKLNINKYEQIAMYCTGGIRCEKASAYLNQNGFKNVYQLEGGILAYFDYIIKNNRKDNLWNGECFVFDNRVTVNKDLKIGSYQQCHGCRHPITKTDMKLKSFKKGVSCKYCFSHRNANQKKRSQTRQRQIEHAEKYKKQHPFKKIYAR